MDLPPPPKKKLRDELPTVIKVPIKMLQERYIFIIYCTLQAVFSTALKHCHAWVSGANNSGSLPADTRRHR